ncbi:PTS system mannose/fructose/sorbose family transporter subunit IID [Bifidobacterium dentium]|uniref:PTS system mannose/fructose/sorbose family transporter subunit IID n=1 Tax=Bifidobacterium dentium TaxID=1689 RepID=UPI003D180135
MFLRYLCVLQSAFNYETHISCGAVYAVEPALKRIYNGDEELHRHSLMSCFRFYNCQAYFSAPLLAASLAVEESMHSVEGVEVAGHMRASLMGPLTGVGDALFNTALKAVMASFCAHYALEGNPLGVVLCMTFGVFLLPVRWKMFLLGYRQGARWVLREHGTMQCLITALLVLESLILGSMIATNVTLPGVADALTGSVFIRQLAVWNLPGLVVFALMYVLLRSRTIQIPPQWMVWIIVIVCVSERFVASLG